MSDYVLVLVGAALVNHLVLQPERERLQALGLCSALLILIALPAGVLLQHALLVTPQLQDLRLFLLLPLLAALAWAVPQLLRKALPKWPVDDLPRILAVNAVVLGLLLQLATDGGDLRQALIYGVLGGLGFWLALALFADLRARSHHPDIPSALRGRPIELIGAGLMAMALSGFNGLFIQ
ncbi:MULTISPECIES: Rnf-Nqr domain containing protein [unclassified Pseudomonas]|uniref:Rnf-Nqr domain containing protein n=1 Tax=unclassified Pseudomonas TaxID=196821 RepID=UPI00244936CC|nr:MULTISPECIES: Rnf-Nqr domain containing protein [unclassified Pseudomonas]MDH0303992.1 electron transporter RnfA [Pseudomonas sp. GD04091]MDH1986159.1 electron transporter RnfA [Pseudomonas sp. GD03689]